jgi:hypothetical protein
MRARARPAPARGGDRRGWSAGAVAQPLLERSVRTATGESMAEREPGAPPEFDMQDGLALALAYLEDPSDVPCPHCGPETIEVVAYLDAGDIAGGTATPTVPEGDYTVVLYCHKCGRAAALDLSRDEGREAA